MNRWLLMLMLLATPAAAHDEFSHAGMDPDVSDWFGKQNIPPGHPNAGNPCCSSADGVFAEEQIRGDHYWVRFPASKGKWIQVPDNVVLNLPNYNGAPAVWWGGSADEPFGGSLYIRCFAPGGKF